MLLTNEHIASRDLEELDGEFYKLYLQERMKKQEDVERKRKESLQRFAKAKKMRIMLESQHDLIM